MNNFTYYTATTLDEFISARDNYLTEITKLESEIKTISSKKKLDPGWTLQVKMREKKIDSINGHIKKTEKRIKELEKPILAQIKAEKKKEQAELDEIEKEKNKYETKQLKEAAKSLKAEDNLDEIRKEVRNYLDQKLVEPNLLQFAYVAQEGCFYYLKFYPETRKAEWIPVPTQHDRVGTPIADKIPFNLYLDEIQKDGLRYIKTYNSLHHEFEGQLNLNTIELQKLQPKEGKPHFLFDVLINSLSGGDPEGAKHIKQIIGYKWLNPGDFKLPMITWSGKGGTGKNLLMRALEIIFGNGSMTSTSLKAFAQYTDSVIGKMVVFLDECPLSVENTEIIKSISGNPTMPFNAKYGKAGNMEINFLMFASSNNPKGPVILAGTGQEGEDRRFSPLELNTSLKDCLDNFLENPPDSIDQAELEIINDTKGNTDFWDSHILNEDNLAMWLNECINEAKALNGQKIKAYHGPSYQKLVSYQAETPVKTLFSEVFLNEDFTWISMDTLFSLYKEKVDADSPRVRKNAIYKNNLSHYVEEWLKTNKLDDSISIKPQKKVKFKQTFKSDGSIREAHVKRIEIISLNEFNRDPSREGYYLPFEDNSEYYIQGKHTHDKSSDEPITPEKPAKVVSLSEHAFFKNRPEGLK